MKPGWIEFTRMFNGANSSAADLARPRTAPLGRDVGVHRGRAAQALDRRHVDDRAAAGRGHRLDGHPHAQERAGQVDVNHLLPLGQIEILQRPERDGAGVVDQHVELAEFADRGRDRGVPLVGLGDVEVHVARGVTDFVGQRLALVVEDVADHHLGALLDQQARMLRRPCRGRRH